MGILNSELNYDLVLSDLSSCCMGESACGSCAYEDCLIGYAKKCITACFKEGVTYVENGSDMIPNMDTKIFDQDYLVNSIAHILRQCRSCQENHFDNCIINIIRNCYEVALFGEIQSYEGSAFRYLNQTNTNYPELANAIIEAFHAAEE